MPWRELIQFSQPVITGSRGVLRASAIADQRAAQQPGDGVDGGALILTVGVRLADIIELASRKPGNGLMVTAPV